MFYENFEGDYRRKPEQSLAGASRRDGRYELLQKAQEERKRREQKRQHHKHATSIQAAFRSYIVRRNIKKMFRNDFSDRIRCLNEDELDVTSLSKLMQELLLFFKSEEDRNHLNWMTSHFLNKHEQILLLRSREPHWQWYIIRLFEMNLPVLESSAVNPKEDISYLIQFFDVFTSANALRNSMSEEKAHDYLEKLFTYIVTKKYFRTIVNLINCNMLDQPFMPSSPSTEILFSLLTRPWGILNSASAVYRENVNKYLYAEVLSSKDFTNVTINFIIPALNSLKIFSFPALISTLHNWSHILPATSEGLHSFLSLDKSFSAVPRHLLVEYLHVLANLSVNIVKLANPRDDVENEMNDDEMTIECKKLNSSDNEFYTLEKCVEHLNQLIRVTGMVACVEDNLTGSVLIPLSKVLHNMLMSRKYAVSYYKLLILISTHSSLIKGFWQCIAAEESISEMYPGQPWVRRMLDALIDRPGFTLMEEENKKMVPLLTTFAALFKSFLRTLPDENFHHLDQDSDEYDQIMPFNTEEVLFLSHKLGNFCLAMVKNAFACNAFPSSGIYVGLARPPAPFSRPVWRRLFEEISFLLKHIYIRDVRRQFAPVDHWKSNLVCISPHFNPNRKYMIGERFNRFRPYQNVQLSEPEDREEGLEVLSVFDVRTLTTLRELPFSVSFIERVTVLQNLLLAEKREYQNPSVHFLHSRSLYINIRRNYMYEDAFENLSLERAPELRIAIRVHFINSLGMEEVGVDGGGVFREFSSELLKSAFDPNRGFFLLNKDNQIYPNPNVAFLHADYTKHYFFIGRMLGKAIFESLLVDLPFADFFLAKLIGSNVDVNLNNMASLDPDLYRNLKYLRGFKGNIEDLGLDFSITVDQYGKTEVIELTPKGTEIGVTATNKIEYIHLVADFKMNKQIQAQCDAFKQGLSHVIPLEWLSIFNTKEIQILISGQESPVDASDLEANATYTGGYSKDHPNIQMFWKVVSSFDHKQRSDLLRFVTSCPRPPLLGFKELDPPFCIQFVEGTGDRLPTASTCMNLLKLPVFPSENVLKEKLLYAIESGSGFELS